MIVQADDDGLVTDVRVWGASACRKLLQSRPPFRRFCEQEQPLHVLLAGLLAQALPFQKFDFHLPINERSARLARAPLRLVVDPHVIHRAPPAKTPSQPALMGVKSTAEIFDGVSIDSEPRDPVRCCPNDTFISFFERGAASHLGHEFMMLWVTSP